MSSHFTRFVLRVSIIALVAGFGASCAAPSTIAPTPTPESFPATLTAVTLPVTMTRAADQVREPEKDVKTPLERGDRITVPESGQGTVWIGGGQLKWDVYRGSEVVLTDVKREASGEMVALLRQVQGHSRVALVGDANIHVRLETDDVTIKTLEPKTDFIVCHNPVKLVCVYVVSGAVNVVKPHENVTYRANEGMFVLKGDSLAQPACGNPDEVIAWEQRKLGTGAVEAISDLVKRWSPGACSAAAAPSVATASGQVSAVTAAAAPPSTTPPLPAGMVPVAAGTYVVGSQIADDFHVAAFPVEMKAFWIDVTEVSNRQYRAFVDRTGHAPPQIWPGRDDHPAAGVTWNDAADFCAWSGKRLPSEAEWEIAARGPGEAPPLYPWGRNPDADGKFVQLPLTDTYPVGSIDFNTSPFGVHDMAGNVWEWVGQPYGPVPDGNQLLRGGRYGYITEMSYRQPAEPNNVRFVPLAGFRCAADQVEGK